MKQDENFKGIIKLYVANQGKHEHLLSNNLIRVKLSRLIAKLTFWALPLPRSNRRSDLFVPSFRDSLLDRRGATILLKLDLSLNHGKSYHFYLKLTEVIEY